MSENSSRMVSDRPLACRFAWLVTGWFVLLLTGLGAAAPDPVEPAAVAQQFIDGYLAALPSQPEPYQSVVRWVEKNPLVTRAFRQTLARLYRDALRTDPELGYGADAILGAQDFPDAGYLVRRVRVAGDTAEVWLSDREKKGQFPLKMQLIRESGRWLINACGDVNPDGKKS